LLTPTTAELTKIIDEGGMVNDGARDLAERYVAIWNEPNAARRRNAVNALWTRDALHILQPPEAVREVAATLHVTSTFQACAHRELEEGWRVRTRSSSRRDISLSGRRTTQPASEVVKFGWEMVASSGEVAAVGLEFVILDADGRIRIDCQFIES
jgi:hypothetical protein